MLPIAPLIVAVVGMAAAIAILLMGLQHLQQASDEAAVRRSKALAAVLAARLRSTAADQRTTLLARTAKQCSATFILIDQHQRRILVDEGSVDLDRVAILELLSLAEGNTSSTSGQRMWFAASSVSPPLSHLSVLAFVDAPAPADGTIAMSNAVAVLTLLMLGVAVVVALLFMRAARDDVTYVKRRIAEMAHAGVAEGAAEGAVAGGAAVAVRSLDQVGVLTGALNVLVERFATAQRSYRVDLRQAAQLDTEQSQFLAGLSHELRTPLNAILGFNHLLETDDDGPLSDDARESLAMIRTSGEQLKSLIDDILDLSAAETGQLRLSRIAVDVFALAEEVVRQARATVGERPIRLAVTGERHVYAWADPRRLRQVLSNLLSNALKATAQGEVVVTIGKRSDDHMALVSITDTGRGIKPQVLQTIFEPYQQAGDAVARRGGAGLGLAIARRLVLLHGGGIYAESEPGRGSMFLVSFPDETHSARVPRDSLVPWSDNPPQIGLIPADDTEAAP